MRPTKLAGIVIVMCLSGCTVWRAQQAAPEAALQLRVTLANGRQMVLLDSRHVGDSLVGVSKATGEEVGVALRDVGRVEVRETDVMGNFILLGSLVAVLVIVPKAIQNAGK